MPGLADVGGLVPPVRVLPLTGCYLGRLGAIAPACEACARMFVGI
jgi:hypothetical protein